MLTLCIRYTIDPNKLAAFKHYVGNELPAIEAAGGEIVGYFHPTDFAGPTSIGYGLIDFATLADYERYRAALAADPLHQRNASELEATGAIRSIERTFIQRHGAA